MPRATVERERGKGRSLRRRVVVWVLLALIGYVFVHLIAARVLSVEGVAATGAAVALVKSAMLRHALSRVRWLLPVTVAVVGVVVAAAWGPLVAGIVNTGPGGAAGGLLSEGLGSAVVHLWPIALGVGLVYVTVAALRGRRNGGRW